MRKWIAGGLAAAALALSACGGAPSSADTGSGSSQPAASEGGQQQAGEARHTVNKEFEVNGLKVKIGEVVVQKDKVLIGMTVTNPGDDTLSFFPDQGNVVVNGMQLDANMFFTEGEVSGEISGGASKEGVVHFLVPEGKSLDPSKVTEIKLNLGEVFNDTKMSAKEFKQTLKLGK